MRARLALTLATLALAAAFPLADAITQWTTATGTNTPTTNAVTNSTIPPTTFVTRFGCTGGTAFGGEKYTLLVPITPHQEYYVSLYMHTTSPPTAGVFLVALFDASTPTITISEFVLHSDGGFSTNAGTSTAKWITDNLDTIISGSGTPTETRITGSIWNNDSSTEYLGITPSDGSAISGIGSGLTWNSTIGLAGYGNCLTNDHAVAVFNASQTVPITQGPTLNLSMAARAINLTWGQIGNASVYNVWRDTATHSITCAVMGSCTMNSTGYNYYGNTTNTWWDTTGDSAINNNTHYFYVVNSANGLGEGPPSNIATWTYNVPNATATPGAGTALLSWNGVNGADHYNIYRALTASPEFSPMNSTSYTYLATINASSTTYTATGLSGSVTYHFRIMPLNASSAEGWASPDVTATPPTDAPPAGLTLTSTAPDGYHAILSWTYNTTSSTQIGFNITRTGDCGTVYATNLTTLLVGLCTGNSTFSIHAWNAAGDGPESNTLTLRIAPQNFGGDNSPLFGGNVTTYASSLGVSVDAVKFSYAGAIILILAAGGAFAISRFSGDTGHVLIGASAGGLTGLGITIAFGWIPLWAILLLLTAITLTIILRMRGGGN